MSATTATTAERMSALPSYAARALRTLQLTLAAVFLVAGAATLSNAPAIAARFGTVENAVGLGAWLRAAAGVLEVVGGVLLVARASAGVGAVLLGGVMVGALAADVLVLRTVPAAPVLFGVALALVAYAHRASLAVAAAFLERNL